MNNWGQETEKIENQPRLEKKIQPEFNFDL